MRDRLIELIKSNSHLDVLFGDEWEKAADELLANGVIVPPVSVGQTVWVYNQTTNNIYKNTVVCIKIAGTGRNANKISVKYTNQRGETSIRKFTWAQIGKQVFLTEEEAANALVERTKNENS